MNQLETPANLVDIWWVGLDDHADVGVPVLSGQEREQARRYVFPSHRRRFEQRRTALRSILARYVRQPPNTLRFSRHCRHCGDPGHGKPVLVAPGAPLYFSTSATTGVAVIAVSRTGEVGVDVEAVSATEDRNRKTLTRWTRYEAVTKGTGRGIVDLRGFDQLPVDLSSPPGWTLVELPTTPPLVGALAVQSPAPPLVTHHRLDGGSDEGTTIPALISASQPGRSRSS